MPVPPPPPLPAAGTNARLVHDLFTIGNVPAEKQKSFEHSLIASEMMKRPSLRSGGAVISPDGIELFNDKQPLKLEQINRRAVLAAAQNFIEENFSAPQKVAAAAAGLLPLPPPVATGRAGRAPARAPARASAHAAAAAPAAPTAPAAPAVPAAPAAVPASLKRPFNEEDLEDEDGYLLFDWNCDQVRRKIRALIESGEMKVTEFQRTIGVNSNSYGRFMKLKGPTRGIDNSTMAGAYRFFKRREAEGKEVPKKRKAAATPAIDLSDVHLEGEDTDSVKVFDSCDEVRRKIAAHLRKPGVTQAQLLKDLAAQFHTQPVKLQSKQLNDFRSKSGADAGNTSRIFYGAYVFFEKLRIKEGKPKGKHRLEMEKIWVPRGGFDTKHSHSKGYWCRKGETPVMDQYGNVTFY